MNTRIVCYSALPTQGFSNFRHLCYDILGKYSKPTLHMLGALLIMGKGKSDKENLILCAGGCCCLVFIATAIMVGCAFDTLDPLHVGQFCLNTALTIRDK